MFVSSGQLAGRAHAPYLATQEDRKAKLEEMERLQEALSRVQKEVAQYAESDPTKVEAMRES